MKKNLISTLMGGAKLDTALRLITKKGKRFKPWVVMVLMFAGFLTQGRGQNMCGFDEHIHPLIQQNPQYYSNWFQEKFSMMSQAQNLSGGTVNIPIVFHVIYHDAESNIPNSQIQTAFDKLNDDFDGTGIEFCLATRDADGNAMTEEGVKRVDGTTIGYSGNMTIGGNEAAVKNLSYFSNMRYLNVWIVSDITIAGVAGNILGIGYFPNSIPRNIDGIVMDRDHFGVFDWHVLSHEVGHYLGLFHTFEGDDPDYNGANFVCPPLDLTQGDHIGDTQAHIRSTNGSCNDGDNSCYAGQTPVPQLEDITNNHMDYSSESCRHHFTTDQITIMKATLMQERVGLTTSLGCTEVCNENWTVDFTQSPPGIIPIPTLAYFTGSINPNANYNQEWYVDGINTNSGATAVTSFNSPQTLEYCFRVNSNNCIKEKCSTVKAGNIYECSPNIDQCNLLINGDFSQINPSMINTALPVKYFDYPINRTADILCNWINTNQTPTGLKLDNNEIAVRMDPFTSVSGNFNFGAEYSDILTTLNPLNLQEGVEYTVILEVRASKPCISEGTQTKLQVGLTDSYENFINAKEIYLSPFLKIDCFSNDEEQLTNINYITQTFPFTYTSEKGKHLFFRAIDDDGNVQIFVKNIKVKSCCPKPKITVTKKSDCKYGFEFGNDGDAANMYWEIESGPSGTGSSVDYSFALPGIYKVCLYATCNGQTIQECVDVDATSCESECSDFIVPITNGAKYCGENGTQLQYSLSLPEGYGPCTSSLYMVPESNIVSSNYYFNENTNQLMVSMKVKDPNQTSTLVLCGPNGNSLCYQIEGFNQIGAECGSCQDLNINVSATCNDTNTNDLNFSYGGNITITPPLGATICGSSSSSGGYSQGTPTNSGGTYTIPFNINTNSPNPFNSEVIICFFDPTTNVKICYKVKIVVSAPCEVEGCLKLGTSTLNCSQVKDGIASFNFSGLIHNSFFEGSGWELCTNNGIVLPFGTANKNIGMQTQSGYIFDFDLTMPCESLSNTGPASIILNFCKGSETICFEYAIILQCEGCDRGEGRRSRNRTDYKIYPSPATNELYVEIPQSIDQTLSIHDLSGKLIEKFKVRKGVNKLSLNNINSGLYYCKFSEDVHIVYKILIIK
jgi:Pregnancy-associated plasma protein-A/Secretion system C-terminal sorting domain